MSAVATASSPSLRTQVQKFGTFLSNMIMPNIGAFIAWGLITSLFIKVGWTPVPELGGWGTHAVDGKDVAWTGLVGPMITYLLPLLIGFTGGKNVYPEKPHRGGVVGAIATMGVIIGSSVPMFIGAMIMGPLAGWTMKKIDSLWDGKIKPGFEMLVDNFSAGIWGGALAVGGFYTIAPVVDGFTHIAGQGVQYLVNNGLLPLTSILIEPAKILFLNNAINHGVLTPLGTAQAASAAGKSVLFLLEANPGPGLGLLLAWAIFGRGNAKASAPGAAIIHFFGGIHEIYFPYVLMKPILVLAMIGGGMTGVFLNVLFGVGLHAPAAPGSIFAVYAQVAKENILGVTIAVLGAAAVAFILSALLMGFGRKVADDDGDLNKATADMEAMKGKKSSIAGALTGASGAALSGPIKNIVFACDAGMGSSAMGASLLRKKIQDAGFKDVKVVNQAIANLTDNYDVIVTHQDLADRAAPKVPSAALFTVDNFLASPVYDDVVDLVKKQNGDGVPVAAPVAAAAAAPVAAAVAAVAAETADDTAKSPILGKSSIVMDGTATTKDEAIDEVGRLLVATGAVDEGYIASMHDREKSVSTYMGNLLAIPHGTNEAKDLIKRSAMAVVKYPNGLDWNGKPVKFVIGIAGANNEHLGLLSKIAVLFSNKDAVANLENTTTVDGLADALGKVNA